ncbi:MAG: 5-formyltetrahydrofolate cyclo-ligase [Actinomycetota bacterium]
MERPGSKAWWRAELRRRDRAVDPAVSAAVRSALRALLDGVDGVVLAYRSLPGEVDLDPLLHGAPDRFALTRTPEEGPLTIHPASSETELHRFGFVQPRADAELLPDHDVAVVLVPGLAFDRRGGRLGRGRGHYDRLLARLGAEVWRVGVTSASSVIEEVPSETHDVPMTHLVTERGAIEVSRSRP